MISNAMFSSCCFFFPLLASMTYINVVITNDPQIRLIRAAVQDSYFMLHGKSMGLLLCMVQQEWRKSERFYVI